MQFTVKLEESDEGGYTVQCLELPAAISEGDTKIEALENIKELFSWFWKSPRSKHSCIQKFIRWKLPVPKLPSASG